MMPLNTAFLPGSLRKVNKMGIHVPKLALVGHSRCGKDLAGKWLGENTVCNYQGSLSWLLNPIIARKMNMSEAECWRRRHEFVEKMIGLYDEIREHDPCGVIRVAIEECNADVITGVRDLQELKTAVASGAIDLIVWIERDTVPSDPAMRITKEDAHIIIENNGSEQDLYNKLYRFSITAGILKTKRYIRVRDDRRTA